jgi:hypothetical protein
MSSHPFEELVYQRVIESVSAWEHELRQDVYALCLLYGSGASADEEGNEVYYQGWVSLSYNTRSHAQEEVALIGTSEPEWNNAYWLHDLNFFAPAMADYGTPPNDVEMQLRDSWCASVEVEPDGKDESGRPTYNEPALYRAVAAMCGQVVRRLHEDDAISAFFGKPIPVVIETSDWSDEALATTKESNPPELLKEYSQWMYERIHPTYG